MRALARRGGSGRARRGRLVQGDTGLLAREEVARLRGAREREPPLSGTRSNTIQEMTG